MTQEKTRVIAGSVALLVGAYFSAIIALLISILLTRFLAKETYGVYVFIISFASICYLFTNFGVDNITNYFIQRYKDTNLNVVKYIINKSLRFKAILSLCVLFVLLLLGFNDIKYYYAAIFFAFFAPNRYTRAFLVSFQHFSLHGRLQIIESLLKLLLLLLLVYFTTPPLSLVILAVGTPMLITSFIAMYDIKTTLPKIKPQIRFEDIKDEFFHYWKWLAIVSIMPTLTGNIMQVTLGLINEFKELAIFGVGYALSNMILIAYTSFRGAMQTSFVKKTDKESISYSLTDSIRYMLMIALFLMPFFHFVSFPLVVTLYTEKYAEAAIILEVLAYRILIEMVFAGLGPAALAIGKPNLRVIADVINITTIVTSAIFLVPEYGAVGAALALLCGSIARTFIFASIEYKYLKYRFPSTTLVRAFAASVIVSLILYNLKLPHIYMMICGVASSLLYIFLLYIIKEINENDIILFKEVLLKKRHHVNTSNNLWNQ